MSISAPEPSIVDVGTTDEHLVVSLDDGREVRTPLAWYPRLVAASPEQRDRWELLAGGEAVSWPSVDEDLSLAGMLAGVPAPGFSPAPETPTDLLARRAVEAARDFYGGSLGQAKALLEHTRSGLTDLLGQLRGSSLSGPSSSVHDDVRALAAALEPVLEAIDDAAYANGAEHAMDAAADPTHGYHAPRSAGKPAEDPEEEAGIDLSRVRATGAGGLLTSGQVGPGGHTTPGP